MKNMRACPWPKDVNIPRKYEYGTSPLINVVKGFPLRGKPEV